MKVTPVWAHMTKMTYSIIELGIRKVILMIAKCLWSHGRQLTHLYKNYLRTQILFLMQFLCFLQWLWAIGTTRHWSVCMVY